MRPCAPKRMSSAARARGSCWGMWMGSTNEEQFKAEQEALDEILPEAFAAVREASKRTIGLRHYDVQMIGGVVLHRGTDRRDAHRRRQDAGRHPAALSECAAGTRRSPGHGQRLPGPPRCALDGADLSTCWACRSACCKWRPRTENGKKAFLVDFEQESPHEDQHQLRLVDRRRGLRGRYHLRHQHRIRLRLPARQHDHAPGGPRPARALLTPSSMKWTMS